MEKAREVLEAMREAKADTKKYISLNRDLHFLIYSYAECPILLEIVSGLWARIGPYLTLNLLNQNVDRSLEIHASMLASFSRRDHKGFKRALLADMRFSHSYVIPFTREM